MQTGAPEVPTTKGAMARGQAFTVSKIVGRVGLSFLLMKEAAVDTVQRQILISELLL